MFNYIRSQFITIYKNNFNYTVEMNEKLQRYKGALTKSASLVVGGEQVRETAGSVSYSCTIELDP